MTREKVESSVEDMERKQKSHNMLIEGIRSITNENLRAVVHDMLIWTEASHLSGLTTSTISAPKNRAVTRDQLCLFVLFLSYKHDLFRNVYKWKGVNLKDCLTPTEQAKRKETQATYAKSKGVDIKMRGSNLIIDSIKYGQDDVFPKKGHFYKVITHSVLGAVLSFAQIVGSVKVNFLSYRYRADKSTNFGMRGLWGLTINYGRGATLKYL